MTTHRNVLLSLPLAAVSIVFACSRDGRVTGVESNDPLVRNVVALGFRSDMIRDMGD
jgi:hypothetical protein